MPVRLLFCSYHSYFDPSSGAALATRDLLEMLAARGLPCAAFSGAQLDFEQPVPVEQLLTEYRLPFEARRGQADGTPFTLYHFVQGGVPVTVYHTPGVRPYLPPSPEEGGPFLALLDGVLDRFRPDLLLTYGGHPLAQAVIARAKARGLPVVFFLLNDAYWAADLFRPVDAVLVVSAFARDLYRQRLGLTCTALPCPLDWPRVRCDAVEPRYLTFVNPQPSKGAFWAARIALELGRLRPDIPLLIKEGRGGAGWLGRAGLDLSGLTNLSFMRHTPDPRDFYRVSRAVLMPSLWHETFGRVAAEATLNGIPVLAARRGALPETLAQAGFLFDVPPRYTPQSAEAPSAAEVAPWVETVKRLWDDADFYREEQGRCRAAAQVWRPERLAPRYEAFFEGTLRGTTPGPFSPAPASGA